MLRYCLIVLCFDVRMFFSPPVLFFFNPPILSQSSTFCVLTCHWFNHPDFLGFRFGSSFESLWYRGVFPSLDTLIHGYFHHYINLTLSLHEKFRTGDKVRDPTCGINNWVRESVSLSPDEGTLPPGLF